MPGQTPHILPARSAMLQSMKMPALIRLTPGSLGYTGMGQIMLSENLSSGIRLIATMMLTSVSFVAGSLLTDVIAPTGLPASNRSTAFSRSGK